MGKSLLEVVADELRAEASRLRESVPADMRGSGADPNRQLAGSLDAIAAALSRYSPEGSA